MFNQTITLFRYQLLGILNGRNLFLLLVIFSVAFLASQFVSQLAILHSKPVALATLADLLRYSLVLLIIIVLSHQVSQDYELSQFERLLAMPLSRLQYVLAQFIVLLVLVLLVTLPVFVIFWLLSDLSTATYWATSVALELLLAGQFTLLAIISLEKLPLAVIFSVSLYLLSKSASLIDLVLSRSEPFYGDESSFQFVHWLFSAIQYLLPESWYFASNNVFFESLDRVQLLTTQFVAVAIYSAFLQSIILIDFYRKEFN